MKMQIIVAILCLFTLALVNANDFEMIEDDLDHHRSKRGVDLPTLRRLMNNIAMSEYYRLRGLEVLGTIGGGKPVGVDTADDAPSTKTKSIFDFPTRNKEFQQFFGALGARRYGRRG